MWEREIRVSLYVTMFDLRTCRRNVSSNRYRRVFPLVIHNAVIFINCIGCIVSSSRRETHQSTFYALRTMTEEHANVDCVACIVRWNDSFSALAVIWINPSFFLLLVNLLFLIYLNMPIYSSLMGFRFSPCKTHIFL